MRIGLDMARHMAGGGGVMGSLRDLVRAAVRSIANGCPSDAMASTEVQAVRDALAVRGLGADCHVGESDIVGEREVEWYAGQLLSVIDARAWFAMNSLINALDKFCPAHGVA